jgi:O-6-methylguanine DNA methyltransferase
MEPNDEWIITRLDDKIAGVSVDYKIPAQIMEKLASMPVASASEVTCTKVSTDTVFKMSEKIRWEDLWPFGTPFQLKIWKALFALTHKNAVPHDQEEVVDLSLEEHPETPKREAPPAPLMSYSEFAASVGCPAAVRQVAHAIAMNPIMILVPCHLIVPAEAIRKLHELEEENFLFHWRSLYIVDKNIDFGEYRGGSALKKRLIERHMSL